MNVVAVISKRCVGRWVGGQTLEISRTLTDMGGRLGGCGEEEWG